MKKTLILMVFLLTSAVYSAADELPNPEQDNLANRHLQDEACAGQCHEGEEVSDDLEFEYQSCIECHDLMVNLDGKAHNIKHQDDEQMVCVDCHVPHEAYAPKEGCIDCHDEEDEAISSELSHVHIKAQPSYFQFIFKRFNNQTLSQSDQASL
ncbi:cytochrome c3 family protein [Vibrio sp. TRT 21S02]|uniref:cytochrome c3 family protein n=1 Tax=Vibrio sp. TRT 21S02 TaxID=3418507 RepID=UPI003CE88DA1